MPRKADSNCLGVDSNEPEPRDIVLQDRLSGRSSRCRAMVATTHSIFSPERLSTTRAIRLELAVNEDASQLPLLDRIYQRYLRDENSAAFLHAVSQRYTLMTLARLSAYGTRVTRRAAMLAIGLLGDYSLNPVLGRGLHDGDRAVRMLADNGIRTIWYRCGSQAQQRELECLARLNDSLRFEEVVERSTYLIDASPWIAETWNQRAVAYFHLKQFADSAEDCHQALELNPYHFAAAIGMAHCYLQLDEPHHALESFRRALRLNPDLESVRMQVEYLERSL